MATLDLNEFQTIWGLDPTCVFPYFFYYQSEDILNRLSRTEIQNGLNRSIDYVERMQKEKQFLQADKILGFLIQSKFLNKEQKSPLINMHGIMTNDVMDAYMATLYSLIGRSIPINTSKFNFSFQIDEKVLLDIFLDFLKESVVRGNNRGFFKLTSKEKSVLQTIIKEMKIWFRNLEAIQRIHSLPEPRKDVELEQYALHIKESIQSLDKNCHYIIPNGLPYPFMDAGAAIVSKNNDNNQLCWTQIMCNSEYHEFYSTQFDIKNICALELEEIESDNLTSDLIQFMTRLKVDAQLVSGKTLYNLSFLYELLISKLHGKVRKNSNKEDYLFKRYVSHHYGQYWYVVINVFHFLLHLSIAEEKESYKLFRKLMFNFKFIFLEKFSKKTLENFNCFQMFQEASAYLVNEMCAELSFEVLDFNSVFGIIDDCLMREFTETIEALKGKMVSFQKKVHEHKLEKHKVFVQDPFVVSAIILPIPEEITSNSNHTISTANRILFPDLKNIQSPLDILQTFQRSFVLEIKKTYCLTNVQRLVDGIEYLVVDVLLSNERVGNDISNWCKMPILTQNENDILAELLVDLCAMYYDCQFRLAYFKKDEPYEPIQYSKTVILLYAVYAMIDALVRQDPYFKEILSEYRLSTALYNNDPRDKRILFPWMLITQNLIVTEPKWTKILSVLQVYFNQEARNNRKLIFKYQAISIDNTTLQPLSIDIDDENKDENISFARKIMSNPQYIGKSIASNKKENMFTDNAKLFYTDNFLPPLICKFRNISILAQVSLCALNLNLHEVPEEFQINKNYDREITEKSEIVYIGQSIYCICLQIVPQSNYCTVVLDINGFNRVSIPFKSLVFSGYRAKNDDINYQRLICSPLLDIFKGTYSLSENTIISTQDIKPNHLTKHEYFSIGFVRANSNLKLKRLLVSLTTNVLSFENENHCYLIKQTIFENHMFLHRYLEGDFSKCFVQMLYENLKKLERKTMQSLAYGCIIEVLVKLFEYCKTDEQTVISSALDYARKTLKKWLEPIENVESQRMATTHAYIILTYFPVSELNNEDVQTIINARFYIENCFSQQMFIPKSLFLQILSVIHRNEAKIDQILNANSDVMLKQTVKIGSKLEPILTVESEKASFNCSWLFNSWKLNENSKLYENDSIKTSFDYVTGKTYQNGKTTIYKDIFKHEHFKKCYCDINVNITLSVPSENNRISYTSEIEFHKKQIQLRFSWSGLNLIIEENHGNDFVRFIPPNKLAALPESLLIGYTHWYSKHKKELYIKNKNRDIVFIYYFESKQIKTADNKTQLGYHFNELHPSNNQLLCEILGKFEDSQFILWFKKDDTFRIELSRLNLSFNMKASSISSNDFHGYCLSEIQMLETLAYIPQYLVLEKRQVSNAQYLEKLIIIANRDINDRALFFSRSIAFNLRKVNAPPYFLYRFDPLFGNLRAETTAGKLYLALLYYKTASLDRDPTTGLNGYENAMGILDSCWQNSYYDEIELSIIKRILQFQDEDISDNEEYRPFDCFNEKFQKLPHSHRNSSSVWLKTLYIMTASLNTHFLFMREEETEYVKKCIILQKYYFRFYFPTYFSRYVRAKQRIHRKCHLTLQEENMLIDASKMYWHHSAANFNMFFRDNQWNYHFLCLFTNYTASLAQNSSNKIELQKPCASNYLKTEMKLLSTHFLHLGEYKKCMENTLVLQRILTVKDLKLNRSDWMTYLFNFNNFIPLYIDAQLKKTKNEKYLYELKLHAFALRYVFESERFEINYQNERYRASTNFHISIDDCFLLLKMLLIVAQCPNSSFPKPPEFLLEGNDKSYNLSPIINAIEAKRELDTEKHGQILCIYNFFMQIGQICDTEKLKYQGKNIFFSESLTKAYEMVTVTKIPDSVKFSAFSLHSGSIEINLEKVEFDGAINAIQSKLKDVFLKKRQTPGADCKFPLDWKTQYKNCNEIRKALDGYGESFITEMRKSWDNYLQSTDYKYSLKGNDCILNVKNILNDSFDILQNLCVKLQGIIEIYFNSLPNNSNGYTLKLLRFAGQMSAPTKTDILRCFVGKELLASANSSCIDSSTVDIENKIKDLENLLKEAEEELNKVKAKIKEITDKEDDRDLLKEKKRISFKIVELEDDLEACQRKVTRKKKNVLIDQKSSKLVEASSDAIKDFNPFLSKEQIELVLYHLDGYVQVQLILNKVKPLMIKIDCYEKVQSDIERDLILQDIGSLLDEQQSTLVKMYPTWQMFELENNLFIRGQQAELSLKMHSDVIQSTNTLYQLNMGEGKSSVILILLSELLTSEKKLVRITVIDPLLATMKALLSEKFGGLLFKRIYLMPFSRNVDISIENLEKIKAELLFCKENKHILLMTPEHRLSFQLKWEEILLDFLSVKSANDEFNWEHYCPHFLYDVNGEFYKNNSSLKSVLVELKYINQSDIIQKYPKNYSLFELEIFGKKKTIKIDTIRCAYNELRSKSIKLKETIEKQLNLLLEIHRIDSVDILDESDEILRYGVELNYTLGDKDFLNGGSMRWKVAEMIFEIIYHDPDIKNEIKKAANKGFTVYIDSSYGGVPQIRIINETYYNQTFKKVLLPTLLKNAKHLFDKLDLKIDKNFAKIDAKSTVNNQMNITDFILGCIDEKNDEVMYESIKTNYTDDSQILCFILTVKGWLSHHVLFYVLSSRYRVEYGLDLNTSLANSKHGHIAKKLAVPFKSKDLPTPRTEFSHPDIKIGFTVISYLYLGLSSQQITEVLLKLKNSSKDYSNKKLKSWVEFQNKWSKKANEDPNSTDWMKSFDTLDTSDPDHIAAFTERLKQTFPVICFYLNNLVFPEGTKQFKYKITGNACTLVKNAGTVGFSGTDDKKVTMPILVKSNSYDEISNGKMLHILSRPINEKYYSVDITTESKTDHNPLFIILDEICKFSKKSLFSTSILIDSGALLTNLTNLEVAQYLLDHLDDKFQGCVHFDDSTSKIVVLLRNSNSIIPYVNCHLQAEQLFTYLDDAHTRGTDLKFPATANGIVTIGKDMNKDKLMQASMRLRQLNAKQSVSIFGTKELSLAIANLHEIEISEIKTRHVLNWVTYNTIMKIKKDLFHVVLQNVRSLFKQRALHYQQNCQVPIFILIENCKDTIMVDLEYLYTRSTRKQDPCSYIDFVVNAWRHSFWVSFEDHVEIYEHFLIERNNSEATVKTMIKNDQLKDAVSIQAIIDDVRNKYGKDDEIDVPRIIKNNKDRKVEVLFSEIDKSQEVQMEIEIMQVDELPLQGIANPLENIKKNFDLIYSPQFYEADHFKSLQDCFTKNTKQAIYGIDAISWNPSVFATKNFKQTVSDNIGNHFEYMRPVEFILICRYNECPVAILLSGYEAEEITKCLEYKHDSLALVHLKALNSDIVNMGTSVPTKITFSDKEIELLTIIKLFNGECHYSESEIKYLRKIFCQLDKNCFIEEGVNEAQSECLYTILKTKGYITSNGFFTIKLCGTFSKKTERFEFKHEDIANLRTEYLKNSRSGLNQPMCIRWMEQRLTKLDQYAKEGICKGLFIYRFPSIMKTLVEMRGRIKEYECSPLREIFEK